MNTNHDGELAARRQSIRTLTPSELSIAHGGHGHGHRDWDWYWHWHRNWRRKHDD